MDLLSFPFRLASDGTVATVLDGSDDANAEALAVLVQTIRGERPLAPDFGVTDPAWAELTAGEVNAQLDRFGPAIRVTDVTADPDGDRVARTVLTYEEV